MNAPKPYTVTPPGTPRASASVAVTPAPAPPMKTLAVTPPSAQKLAAKRSYDFATTTEKSRQLVKRKSSASVPEFPTSTPLPVVVPLLATWSSDVRVLLAVTEIVSQLDFTGSATKGTLSRRNGATTDHLHTIDCPPKEAFLSMDTKDKGIGKLKVVVSNRKGHEDEVTSCDTDMDLLFIAVLGLDERRTPFLHDLVRVIIEVVGVSVHWFKDAFAVPRPYQLAKLSEMPAPMLDHPGHASFPAGHAAQAAALAGVLAVLAGDRLDKSGAAKKGGLDEVAALVAKSREFAGLHYPIDTEAGLALGAALGEYLAAQHGSFPKLSTLWALAVTELSGLGT